MATAIADPEILTSVSEQSPSGLRLRYFCYATLVVAVVIFAAVRIRLRTAPLERDEGEYAYLGQLMLQGIPPYQLAYNMKLPGTYAVYAVMMAVFGQTIVGIRIGMLVVLLTNTLLLFLLTRRLFGLLAATVAATAYTLMANRWSTMSLDGHATHFIVLATLAGTLVLLQAIDSQKKTTLFFSGVFFGLAFLMKQHGILFAAFGFLFWAWSEWKRRASWRRLMSGGSILAAGIALPFLVTCLIIWHAGAFSQFWFWTVRYGAAYEKLLSWSEGKRWLRINLPRVPRPAIIWLTAGFGLTALFWNRRAREHRVFVLGFLLFSILAVCPGLYFRPHYFLVMLPPIAILAGIGISAADEYLQERRVSRAVALIPIAFFVLSYLSAIQAQKEYLFKMDPSHVNRQMHPDDGFTEAVTIGEYVRNHTTDKDRIAVLASEPEIYFYARRHSVTGYIYMYPLIENQNFAARMRSEMIHDIEESQPKLLLYIDNQFSWGCAKDWPDPDLDPSMKIFTWMHDYLDAHYDLMAELPIQNQSGAPCSYFVYQRR